MKYISREKLDCLWYNIRQTYYSWKQDINKYEEKEKFKHIVDVITGSGNEEVDNEPFNEDDKVKDRSIRYYCNEDNNTPGLRYQDDGKVLDSKGNNPRYSEKTPIINTLNGVINWNK